MITAPVTRHRARWVLPIDALPIDDGALVVDADGRILDVGSHASVEPPAGAVTIDHGDAILLPGLVNAHTHLGLSHLTRLRETPSEFGAWLSEVAVAASQEPVSETALDAAIHQSIRYGTVLVGEVANGSESLPRLLRSGLCARVFHELIGFQPRDAGRVFGDGRNRLLEWEAVEDEAITGSFAVTRSVRHSLAAHAPYSVSSRLLRLIRGFNAGADRPGSIHLAESPDEDVFFMDGSGSIALMKEKLGTTVSTWEPPEQSSVAYLSRVGWFEQPGMAVHCTQLGKRGAQILARAGMTACLCPRSNARLGVGTAPVPMLLESGVQLALGTDSLVSAPTLSVFDEIAQGHADHPGVDPAVWIEAATLGGARALGFAGALGSLTPGKVARAVVVQCAVAGESPYAELVSGVAAGRVQHLDPWLDQLAKGASDAVETGADNVSIPADTEHTRG